MTDNILASVLAAAAGVGALTVAGLVKRADRRRALACLAAQPCPRCGRIYGDALAGAVNVIQYHWVLAPRHTIADLGLPRTTYLVVCPACGAESEFRENGRIFVHPQMGVLDFTRVGNVRHASPKAAGR